MSAWAGMDNALVTSDMEPDALAPTSSAQFQWPRWGQFIESSGREGERPALAEVNALVRLYEEWRMSSTREQRRASAYQQHDAALSPLAQEAVARMLAEEDD